MYEKVKLWAVPYRHVFSTGQWADVTMYFESEDRAKVFAKDKNSEAIKSIIKREKL